MYINVNIGGKERGLKFNQMSLEVFTKNLDENAIKSTSIYATFYAGLVGNCYAKREEPDFTFEQVVDWVDELYETDQSTITKVCDAWEETNVFRTWLAEFQDRINTILGKEKKSKKKVK
jgi:cytochrome c1